jgi:hypothetical protein
VVPILKSTPFSDASGSLADGIYTAAVHAAGVTDALGRSLDADQSATFHRLYGDVNGDRKVSNGDFATFSNTFGLASGQAGYNRYFDIPGLGNKISNADFAQFSNRFGKSLNWVSYSYVTDQSVYSAPAGTAVSVRLYLKETPGAGNASLITAENGLEGFAVQINRAATGLPAGPSSVFGLAADAVDFPDFSGSGYTFSTSSGGVAEGAVDVTATGGVPLANTGGGASPAVAGEVYLGTLTVTAGTAGGTTPFTLGALDPVNGGSTVTRNNLYDLDLTPSNGLPAYAGVGIQTSTFTVLAT